MSDSIRITSLFAGVAKSSGNTYYSGKLGGDKPFTILPGQRISLVKSSKTASNGAEIWSLLVDPAGAGDREYVSESTSNRATGDRRPAAQYRERHRLDDEIPF